MRHKRHALIVISLLPLFVFASAEEGGHPSVLADLLAKFLNFALLFGGLALVLAKPLKAFLQQAADIARKALAEAAAGKEEAEQRLGAIRDRLAQVGEEARRIEEGGTDLGRRDKARIAELAAREAEKVKAMAREEIESRAQAAERGLRQYAAELAVSLARRRIDSRLTPELQARLIDESIDILGRENEERSAR